MQTVVKALVFKGLWVEDWKRRDPREKGLINRERSFSEAR